MIIDASAIVALATFEPDWQRLAERLDQVRHAATHPVSLYEASLALARIKGAEPRVGREAADEFIGRSGIDVVVIGAAEAAAALDAHARFGRGRHPARLNMGDCFSYACAKVRSMPLLYKGGDFALTDLA